VGQPILAADPLSSRPTAPQFLQTFPFLETMRSPSYNALMVTGIEHIAIATPDPLKLARWYVDTLGFTINWQPPHTTTVFVKAPDGSMLELIESPAPLAGVPAMREPGRRHLAIMVSDFDAEYRRLIDAGIQFLGEPEREPGKALAFFTDCDGNILHLLYREKPLP
jgi:catechol 2,3-dioxygenase-like lactoylglutathione lyase family enzyme